MRNYFQCNCNPKFKRHLNIYQDKRRLSEEVNRMNDEPPRYPEQLTGNKPGLNRGNKYKMIVSLDVSGSDSDAQDLFLFSECTTCEVPSAWSCRRAQAFVMDSDCTAKL